MELTKVYFDKHYEELHDFLSQQFERVFARFDSVATKDKLAALDKRVTDGFAELAIKSDFMQADYLLSEKTEKRSVAELRKMMLFL